MTNATHGKSKQPRKSAPAAAPVGDLAQRVQDAFRRSVRAAVVGHIERGETVVGQIHGEWRELQAEDLNEYLGKNR